MKCPWCGADSPVGAISCYNCGITWSAENGPKPSPNEIQWQNRPRYQPAQPDNWQAPSKPYQMKPRKQPNHVNFTGIIVVIVLIMVLVSIAVIGSGNIKTRADNQIIGPLDGTWTTESTTIFYMKTDWPSGQLTDVGFEARNVTFVITSTSEPEKVDVEMYYSVVFSTVSFDSFYYPDPSPERYDGNWNGNYLELSQDGIQKGVFTFTDTVMTGTWDDLDQDSAFSQECYTSTDAFMLQRPWVGT